MRNPNPIQLPARFEIRRLTEHDVLHALAIMTHSRVFHSPLWTVLYPEDQTERAYRLQRGMTHFVTISCASGYSYGVFDREYQFKRPESAAEGGKLWWDEENPHATKEDLLKQMDFPLVSIALAYDGGEDREGSEWLPFLKEFPAYSILGAALDKGDKRNPASWKPRGMGQVIKRAGTATRADYAGFRLAKGMAHWHLYEMARLGFEGYQILTLHPALKDVFLNPPVPFKGELVSVANTKLIEAEVDGETSRPFGKCGDFDCCLMWVRLR